jgi:type II secretory pathway pseudopilin PulG
MRTYKKSNSILGFTMMEILGATGVVMLLTAVVGTTIMGVVDSSRDAAIER